MFCAHAVLRLFFSWPASPACASLCLSDVPLTLTWCMYETQAVAVCFLSDIEFLLHKNAIVGVLVAHSALCSKGLCS